jgi:para-aminobenzoate synthetase/4-amino-4-deoxychorismate lyase
LSISSVFKTILGLGEPDRGCHNAGVFDRRRPDPALGVFETLLVIDGRAVELDAHLSRLRASLAALFPDRTPPPLDVPSAGTSQVAALRIAVAPEVDGELAATIERRPATGHFAPDNGGQSSTEAVSLPLAGGLGAHKWVDRSLLDEAQERLPAGALPLILDEDGAVLEASRANVFAVRDGVLLTPPLDGRILPGVTRMRVLEVAATAGLETDEIELSGDDLLTADEVFLTGSVRGVERVRELDGAVLPDNDEVTGRIAAELRKAWLGAQVG